MALTIKWINHIEAWQRTGLKQSDYCRQQGLNDSTFGARLSEYRKEHKGSLPALIPVELKPSITGVIVFKHAQGHKVELPLSISANWLAELLRCLN
jgi:hypothetical protein